MKKKALLLTVLSLAAATFLAACGGEGGEEQHQSSKPEPALLYSVSNGGFETGDLSGWDITRGNAFSALGVTDEFFDPDSDGLVPYDKDGAYLYGRYKESATGEMLSSVFTLAGSGYMTFKMGGGALGALTYVSVVDADNGTEYFRYGNSLYNDTDVISDPDGYRVANLVPYYADMSSALGKKLRLKIVDESTANGGYLTLDSFVTYYAEKPDLKGLYKAKDIKPVFNAPKATPNALYNGDFSFGSLDGWTVEGDANSFNERQISGARLSNASSPRSTGVLRSDSFKVGGECLVSFRLGGTRDKKLSYLTIKKVGTNEEVFRTYSNRWKKEHGEATHLYFVDLKKYRGECLYFEVVDNDATGEGFVSLEDFQTLYTTLPKVTDEIAVNINEPIVTDYGYAATRNYVDRVINSVADEKSRLTLRKTFYATIDGVSNSDGEFPSVLRYNDDGTTFVYTGDIYAMWLRDSSAQVLAYLRFTTLDPDMRLMIKGLIKKQAELIRRDPYANAFNPDGSVFEKKFEIDSLCYPVWLAYNYYKITGDASVFDAFYKMTMQTIVSTLDAERRHSDDNYRISNENDRNAGPHDVNTDCGLIWSGYRPSDDVCYYKFFIPGNMFAVATLNEIAEISLNVYGDRALYRTASEMAAGVRNAIETYGVYDHPVYGRIYAFEVNGKTANASSSDGKLLMDAANIPSLISAPWLGYCENDDPVYVNTRAFVLSDDNPYYYVGAYASGIGDPHDMVGSTANPHKDVPVPWHMSIAMQALTSSDPEEIATCIRYMTDTTAGTYVMHEAFNANDPASYSRKFFTWPCALYAQVVLNGLLDEVF